MPNEYIATGNISNVYGKEIRWKNVFENIQWYNIIHGKHYNLASVLEETKYWVEDVKEDFQFVDPEIGNMALGAEKSGVMFSYLHIISDNLVEEYDEDLSNERKENILKKRKQRYDEIIKYIRKVGVV